MKKIVIALLALLALLHQDYWFWNDIEPLVLGFIPIGLAYHIAVSLAAAALWALAVRHCWPADVDTGAAMNVGVAEAKRDERAGR